MVDLRDMLFSAKLAGEAATEGFSLRQVVEALEETSDVQQSNVPAYTYYKTDGTYARYVRTGSTASLTAQIKALSYTDGFKKVQGSLYVSGGTQPLRVNESGIFPAGVDSFGSITTAPAEKMCMKINPERFGTIHPAFAAKYTGCMDGEWFAFEDGNYRFTDIFSLTDATAADYIVICDISGSGKYAYLYSGETPPVFEVKSGSKYGAAGSQTDSRYDLGAVVSSGGSKYYSAVQGVTSSAGRTDTFLLASIVHATFDIKDAGGNILFAKNAEITDFVKEA